MLTSTIEKLRKIYGMTGEKMLRTVDRLVTNELSRLEEQEALKKNDQAA